MRKTKPTGKSEVIARLRKAEGFNDKRNPKPERADSEPLCDHCKKLRSGYFGAWPFPCPDHN